MFRSFAAIVVVAVLSMAAGVQADTIWDEGTNGPLSTNTGSPTPLTLVSPSDQVIGSAVAGNHVFQITVPVGNTVSSMIAATPTGLMTVEVVSAAINCPPRTVHLTSAELLDGVSCAPNLPPGAYTFVVFVETPPQPWDITIASDVPVELLSLTVE